jgi:hypothetical protein
MKTFPSAVLKMAEVNLSAQPKLANTADTGKASIFDCRTHWIS